MDLVAQTGKPEQHQKQKCKICNSSRKTNPTSGYNLNIYSDMINESKYRTEIWKCVESVVE